MAKTNKGRKFFATTATAALVASAIVPVASAAQVNDFNSIASYAQEAVQDLVDRGVVQGDANGNFQPRKSVSRAEAATILTGALGLSTSENVYFTDVKSGAWYYDAINAAVNNGVFSGKGEGKFDPNGNLTRGEAAVILVNAFGLEGSAPLAQFADEKSVKAWAKEALEIAVGNGVVKGDNGKIKANDAITKQDFAVMFSRAEAAADAVETVNSVKAINATTVEVTFPEAITDLAKHNFAIDGLTIEGKVVKQTDNKTVVLTTSTQTAGTEYTVTVDGEAVGKFVGLAEVIPTKIDVETKSVQGVIGEQVTLTAKVTVPEGQSVANVPVTFNVTNDVPTSNEKKEATVLTNAEGVATYTYTRYYNGVDSFAAYATKKSSVVSNGKVYWAAAKQLTVKDITEATTLVNGDKKVYEINSSKNKGGYVFVAFEENLNKTPDLVTKDVTAEGVPTYVLNNSGVVTSSTAAYPYELTTGGKAVIAVKLDSTGKANLVLTGADASVTPIVYEGSLITGATDTTNVFNYNALYSATALQAKATTVKFELKHSLGLTLEAKGEQNAAISTAAGTGGRDYVATYINKDGKAASAGSVVYVAIPKVGLKNKVTAPTILNSKGVAITSINSDANNFYYAVTVEAEGKATFTVTSPDVNDYVAPVTFINNGTSAGIALDKSDLQATAEQVFFVETVKYTAKLKALNTSVESTISKAVSAITADGSTPAYFVYQLVDQNGKLRTANVATNVTFTVQAGEGALLVNGVRKEAGSFTQTTVTLAAGQNQISIPVIGLTPSSATVTAVGSQAGIVLNTTEPASQFVSFTQYSAVSDVTGFATAINTTSKEFALTVIGSSTAVEKYSYKNAVLQQNGNVISEAAFEALLQDPAGAKVVATVKDGVYTFNVIGIGTPTLTLQQSINQQIVTKEIAGTTTPLTLSIAGTAPANGLVVATTGSFAITLTGSLTGDLVVNTPNSTVTNTATVSGTTTIQDVNTASFINDGGSLQAVVIKDTNGTRFVNKSGTIASLEIAGAGSVVLGGIINQLIVSAAATITADTTDTPVVGNVISEVAGATLFGTAIAAPIAAPTVVVTTATGDTVELTFATNVNIGDVTVTGGTQGTVSQGSALNKVVAVFGAPLTSTDTVTVTVTGTNTGSTPTKFKFEYKLDGTAWVRK